ncbi:MAG: hypothetical protein ACLRZ2_07595 [Veillonella sp.]
MILCNDATITGCAYEDILVHTEYGPTVRTRLLIFILLYRFNIAVDDWSALSESERHDAVLTCSCSGVVDIAFLTAFILGAAVIVWL